MRGPHYYFAGLQASNTVPVQVLGRGKTPEKPEPLQVLTSVEDVRAANRRALAGAQRLLSIYSLDLEPKLYEQGSFLDAVQRFLLSHSFAKIRVLTQRPVPYSSPHKLAAMRRRLSGHIEIRTVSEEFRTRTSGMLIADSRAIVYRAQVTSWEGVAGFEQPPIARLYLQEFDEMWVASVPKY
jgi:hypothetical protein